MYRSLSICQVWTSGTRGDAPRGRRSLRLSAVTCQAASHAAVSAPASWQSRQRASYAVERSDDDRLARVRRRAARRRAAASSSQVPPQRWHTACSLSTNSARGEQLRHRPERQRAGSPGRARRRSRARRRRRARAPRPRSSARRTAPRRSRRRRSRAARATSSAQPSTGTADMRTPGVADDVGGVVAVVDARLEEEHALAGDLRAPQPADHLLALAGEHRPADDLEPASPLRRHPDHGRDAVVRPVDGTKVAHFGARSRAEMPKEPCYTHARLGGVAQLVRAAES